MMVKEKSINKLYAFALAAVFALTLAGCGGGGSTATAPPDDTPMPTPQEQCTTAGNVYVGGECITPAQHAFNMCVAGGGRDNGDGTCTSAADVAAEEAAIAATTKAAGTKETAIAAEMAENSRATNPLNAGLGGTNVGTTPDDTSDDAVVTTYSMTIERDRSGTTVKIADTALAGDDDPKFTQAMDLGGGRTMHTRAMAADDDGNVVEEVVVVSTDIEGPTAVAFAKFEEDVTGTLSQALNVTTDTTNDDPTTTNEALDVSGATSAVAARLSNIKAAGFAASGAGQQSYAFDDPSTTDDDEAFETAGTYNGASGTYRCNGGTACTITYDAEGKITAIGTDWIFTPAAGAMSDQSDYDYYSYGFWLKKTTDEDGAVTYNEVETFATSSVAASGDVSSVLGRATYEGGATGVYVKNVYNSDRTLDTATSGHFTADVNLMVVFGQVPVSATDTTGTIAPNLLHTLTGTIDNFALSGGEDQEWSVAVEGDFATTLSNGTVSGTAKGGDPDEDGSFSATFHGSVTAVDGVVPQPGSVVGEFNAGFTDGSVAGGFGARKVAAE